VLVFLVAPNYLSNYEEMLISIEIDALTYINIGIEYGTPKSPYIVDHNTFG
jgi:hypothetical protein